VGEETRVLEAKVPQSGLGAEALWGFGRVLGTKLPEAEAKSQLSIFANFVKCNAVK